MTLNKYYKEKDYAEEMLRKRDFDVRSAGDLKILAKYLKYIGEEKIEDKLMDFCKKKGKKWFKEAVNYKLIDNSMLFIQKKENKLVQIENIPITKGEMEYIESLPYGKLEKKILFTFIVINKLKHLKNKLRGFEVNYNQNYFGGSGSFSYKTLMKTLQEKLSRNFKEKGIHKTIKMFNDDGLTRTTQNTALELLFINSIEESDEIVIEVKDFDTIGLYYDYWIGESNIAKCEDCNYLIKKTSGNKRRCEKCAKKVFKEQVKNNMKKYRNKML